MRKSSFLLKMLLCFLALGLIANAYASISPTTLTATLCPGESICETKTVYIPELIPKGDVMFAFDLTGSMGPEIDDAHDYAADIMGNLSLLISDVQFGVITFMDYVGIYTSYGYSARYGYEDDDYPYNLDQPLTSDTGIAAAAFPTSADVGYGADYPQDYTRIIYESYSDAAIGYRDGAKKFLIIFGDASTHDNDFYNMLVYTTWAGSEGASTGGDPGRDTDMFTTDDLDFQTTVAEAVSAGITILAIDSSERHSSLWDGDLTAMAHESFEYMAVETGGQRYDTFGVIDPGEIADAVVDMMTAELVVGTLTLSVDPVEYAGWVSFTQPSYTDVSPLSSRDFEVTITVPVSTLPCTYYFEIWANGDGADYGRQEVTITVPPMEVIPEVPLGTLMASAAMIIALLGYIAIPKFRKYK